MNLYVSQKTKKDYNNNLKILIAGSSLVGLAKVVLEQSWLLLKKLLWNSMLLSSADEDDDVDNEERE